MNITTVSGIYENARIILRHLDRPTVTHLRQELHNIADDPKKLGELALAINSLESHVRVLGMDEIKFGVA